MHNAAIETADWEDRLATDDAAYREQIQYLFECSRFYREKLSVAGFETPESVAGLEEISKLPLTEKGELRANCTEDEPIGAHLAAPVKEIARIFSTSGTTGTPSYIPLTREDLDRWIQISCRSYASSGVSKGQRIVSTYNAGPFVAGAALEAFARLGLCHIPVGSGNTERLMAAVRLLKPEVVALTPSYALHLSEWAEERRFDLKNSNVTRLLVAGEPGGGEPAFRDQLQNAWGAQVTEAMGIGDISVSLWGECEARQGMHFSGRGLVHFELIDPESGKSIPIEESATGELVYTHLRHRAAPLLRFRSRDHVIVHTGPCSCGRTAPRVRCIGRTDDMLIVRGVNVFPTAVREVVSSFEPHVTGVISIRPAVEGVKQTPPLPITVERGPGTSMPNDLADRIKNAIREKLLFTPEITLVDMGTLPRSDYKSKLVDWAAAHA